MAAKVKDDENGSRIVHVIVNPISGRGRCVEPLAVLTSRLREAGYGLSVRETDHAGHARELAARACREGARCLVVVGGDGTLNEAVSGAEGSETPILILAGGTENIMAKCLGLASPRDSFVSGEHLFKVLREGCEAKFDVAAVNGKPFTLILGVGFDAEVVRQLAAARAGHISYLTYVKPIWQTFWGYQHPDITVEADGEIIHRGPGMAFIGNVPRYAIGLRILHDADPCDGLLDVCVMPCRSKTRLLALSARVLMGWHTGASDLVYRQAKKIRITSETTVPMQIDGDVGGVLPADIEIRPTPVRFLVPATWRP